MVSDTSCTHFMINGDCMSPLICEGDVVAVQAQRRYWPGDVVVFRAANTRLFAHRAIGLYRKRGVWKYVTASDSGQVDAAITSSQILGKVVDGCCRRKAFEIPLASRCVTLLRFLGYSSQQLLKIIYARN